MLLVHAQLGSPRCLTYVVFTIMFMLVDAPTVVRPIDGKVCWQGVVA
jgi:hypothetical protein